MDSGEYLIFDIRRDKRDNKSTVLGCVWFDFFRYTYTQTHTLALKYNIYVYVYWIFTLLTCLYFSRWKENLWKFWSLSLPLPLKFMQSVYYTDFIFTDWDNKKDRWYLFSYFYQSRDPKSRIDYSVSFSNRFLNDHTEKIVFSF